MHYTPEPPYTHGTIPKVGVLLLNLGTPCCADRCGAAAVSETISVRSARDRDSALGVVAHP